jgi:hypothetical protein
LFALLVYYIIVSFIATYFMTGLAGIALRYFAGGDASFGDGISIANRRIGIIFGYSLISATIGVALSALRSRGGSGGCIAGALGGTAWAVITFLVIPIIAAKGIGPVAAIKESGSLLRRTWGEQLVGSAGIGLVLGLAMLAVFLLTALLAVAITAAIESLVVVIAVAAIGLMIIIVLAVISSSQFTEWHLPGGRLPLCRLWRCA